MEKNQDTSTLCGLWVAPDGTAHLAWRKPGDKQATCETREYRPFLWADCELDESPKSAEVESLKGERRFNHLYHFDEFSDYKETISNKEYRGSLDYVRSPEQQVLLQSRIRMFDGLTFEQLRRCQVDIETASSEGSFSNPRNKGDRVLAIGLRCMGEITLLELEEDTDKAERELLKSFNKTLCELDPDIIEGHNIYNFDLHYLRQRSRRFKLACEWGRFGQEAAFRNSRLRVAERWIDYQRCDIPGRAVADTYLLSMLYDISTRDMPSYSLKEVAVYFDISDPETRTYIAGHEIADMFTKDRERFRDYLKDDLRETDGIGKVLLPTYVAQVRNFAMSLQEATLRGTGAKVDALFLENYYHERHSLPEPQSVEHYEGGFTRSFETGVFQNILHFDVASLYPSLLMHIGRNPEADDLGAFMPMLKQLREYRLKYKKLARESDDASLCREYDARQASYKILINSFYGYLGFEGARFADGALAAEVTRRGRELLQALIEKFQEIGCVVLEADTDGIYLCSDKFFEQPEKLLAQVSDVLPEGIELEYDGCYESMFCYKAKNYALYDGKKITIRGSALRSRGIEPFLKELSDALIGYKLGAVKESPAKLVREMREKIDSGEMPVDRLAKREYLSMNPGKYAEQIEKGTKKARRASLEVALKMEPQPRMGEQVAYFITKGEKKRMPDWQVARPLEQFDAKECPYDAAYYNRKLDDWLKRYGEFLDESPEGQGELFES